MSELNIAELRRNYTKGGLLENDLPAGPVELLKNWMKQAVEAEVIEPNAISLATERIEGGPNVRIVLIKGIENESIHFFTNYKSEKGMEIEDNPRVSAAIWWPELERQIRFSGTAEKLSVEENESYFNSRPRESKLGAWASDQSSPVESRVELEKRFRAVEEKYNGDEVPMPDYWGGYAIRLDEVEFWQGRPGRLHDRIRYKKLDDEWKMQRLQP